MEAFEVNVENRELAGKSMLRKVKNEGFIPGIIYSKDKTSIPVSVEEQTLRPALNKNGEDAILRVNLNQRELLLKIKEVQRDPVTQEIKHIDLMPVDDGGEAVLH